MVLQSISHPHQSRSEKNVRIPLNNVQGIGMDWGIRMNYNKASKKN